MQLRVLATTVFIALSLLACSEKPTAPAADPGENDHVIPLSIGNRWNRKFNSSTSQDYSMFAFDTLIAKKTLPYMDEQGKYLGTAVWYATEAGYEVVGVKQSADPTEQGIMFGMLLYTSDTVTLRGFIRDHPTMGDRLDQLSDSIYYSGLDSVKTIAGTFKNCYVFESKPGDRPHKAYFKYGVGLVKEEQANVTESELRSYIIKP
jgi:hypothetical protein